MQVCKLLKFILQCLICYKYSSQGNKKGPIKRWDFETEEDYHSYMENREALPK